jgi:hypothetical protein
MESAALPFAQHGAPYAWLSRRRLTRSGDVSCLTSPCGHVSEAHKRPRAALHNMMHAAARHWYVACHDAAVKTGSGVQDRAAVRSLKDADDMESAAVTHPPRAALCYRGQRRGLVLSLTPLDAAPDAAPACSNMARSLRLYGQDGRRGRPRRGRRRFPTYASVAA